MKQLIIDLYWEVNGELEKIKKSNLSITERIAYETAITKLEVIKKILNITDVSLK